MLNSQSRKVTVLGSGVALGVYIPALLLDYQFRELGLESEAVILENYYTNESLEKLKAYKKAYHNNFSVALMGHRMTKDVSSSLDENLVSDLLRIWQRENRLNFVVWSGLWMPILEKYRNQIAPQKLNLDICRIDADISATFKIHQDTREDDNEVWFWNWQQKRLIYELPVTEQSAIPYRQRSNRFVIHGGGWGIGTYQNRILELAEQGISLDVVAYDVEEVTKQQSSNRYFMVDPDWFPWIKNQKNQHEFPPFGEVIDVNHKNFQTKAEYHCFYDLAKQSKAIISKPGGGTLIDSLSSATPVILLEPYGYAEEKNAAIWEYLGYGISYEAWKATNYSFDVLEQLHQNLLNQDSLINYPRTYANRLLAATCNA